MACPLPHTINEIQALVKKLIDKDIIRQKALMELAMQFDNASATKNDLRKAYEKCNDISQESRALTHNELFRSYALSWKLCQGDSLNLPDHRIHINMEIEMPHSS
ncbi:hypothetical protein Tco_0243336 [Tanacetum coccineum]